MRTVSRRLNPAIAITLASLLVGVTAGVLANAAGSTAAR